MFARNNQTAELHPQPTSTSERLSQLLDAVKAESEAILEGVSVYKIQRDEYELKLNCQLKELSNFQQNLYELERAHAKLKGQYEEEIMRLRKELELVSSQSKSENIRPVEQQPPPNLGSNSNGKGVFAPLMNNVGNEVEHVAKRLRIESEPPIETTSEKQVVTGECVLSVDTVPPSSRQEGSDWFVLCNPDSVTLKQSRISVDLVHTFDLASVVCCVKFSNCGNFLATGCNHFAMIYDVKTGQKLAVLGKTPVANEGEEEPEDLYIRSVVFSPDAKFLATGAEDRVIRVWDIATGKIKQSFLGHEQEIYSLDWSRDGTILVSGSGDRCLKVWDMGVGKCVRTMNNGEDKASLMDKSNEPPKDSGVTSVAISPLNSRCVVSGSLDKVIRVWDSKTGHLLERFDGHQDSVYSVAFSPDGRSLVSGSLDQTLKVWDISDQTLAYFAQKDSTAVPKTKTSSSCRHTLSGHKDFVLSVAYAGINGSFGRVNSSGDPVTCAGGDALAEVEWVVSGSKDWTCIFWDARAEIEGVAKGEGSKLAVPVFMLQGHINSVISIGLSPTGGMFATGSGDCRCKIWRVSAAEALGSAGPSAGSPSKENPPST